VLNVTPPTLQSSPTEFVLNDVLPKIETLAEERDLNQVTSLVVAAAGLISNGTDTYSDLSKKKQSADALIDQTSKLDATSVETIGQMLNAFHAVKSAMSREMDIEENARSTIHDSMKRIMNLSKSFSQQLISLEGKSQSDFMQLITSNVAYEVLERPTSKKRARRSTTSSLEEESLSLLKELYNLVLDTTIVGEKAKLLESEYVTTSLERHSRASLVGSKYVGNCSVAYQLNNLDELVEIAECSVLNPYETVEGQTSITSLTFGDYNENDVVLSDVRVHIGVPVNLNTSSRDELSNITHVVTPGNFIVTQLVNFTEPDSGWESSALHVVVDILEDESDNNRNDQLVYAQLLFNEKPGMDKQPSMKGFNRNSREEERTVVLQGR